jgi:hypothetical protein
MTKEAAFELEPALLATTCDINVGQAISVLPFVFVVVQRFVVHVWDSGLENHQTHSLGLPNGVSILQASVIAPCMATVENTSIGADRDFLFAAVCSDGRIRHWDITCADETSSLTTLTIIKMYSLISGQDLEVTHFKISAHGRSGIAFGSCASQGISPTSPREGSAANIDKLMIWDHREVREVVREKTEVVSLVSDQIIDFQWGCSNSGQDLLLLSRTTSLVILSSLRSKELGDHDLWQVVWKIDPLK